MFRRLLTRSIRQITAVLAQRQKMLATGVGTSLSIALFSSSPVKEQQIENVLPKNFNLIVTEADELYNNYLIDNCYNILKKFQNSTCSELLWRLARVVCEKSKLSTDPNEKKNLMFEAFEIAQKALENEPKSGCFGAHKWFAILLDYVGEIEGNKSRIEKSYQVRQHLERALEIYDGDATTWHILGLWHFSFADMGYATRIVAKAIFATPPSSTYEQALHYFLKAEQISPAFYSTNTFYIGEVYERIGEKENAIQHFKTAFKMAVITADDAKIHAKALEKLKKYNIPISSLI